VLPYLAAPPQETDQPDFRLPAIAAGTQIIFLAVEHLPQLPHQDIALAALSS
jgi:hypothetical protein